MRQNRTILGAIAFALVLCAAPINAAPNPSAGAAHGSFPDQSAVANNKAQFGAVSSTSSTLKNAIGAKDLTAGKTLIGKTGVFQGQVTHIFSPRDHEVVILDFDQNYRTALVAVVKPEDYRKFPAITSLNGKHVLISGKFIDYQGRPEVEIDDPSEVMIVK